MTDFRTHVHGNGFFTEAAAFTKASRKSASIKLQILVDLEAAVENGLTPDEFVLKHGGLINTIRRRFTDLWKEGKIKHHPTLLTRKNLAGNDCITWVLGKDLNLSTRSTKRSWVGLTDGELSELSASGLALWALWRAIEAKLKEKNT